MRVGSLETGLTLYRLTLTPRGFIPLTLYGLVLTSR
jgi:hypothetical protein